MGYGTRYWAIPQDLHALLFGIIYPALSVICIVILARTVRRRRQGRYALPQRQMDSHLSKLEKHGDDQPAQEMKLQTSRSGSSPRAVPFPTACDILQPLSHLTPLPPSGYLASMLGGGLSVAQVGTSENESTVMSDCKDIHRDDDRPTTSDTNDSRVDSFAESQPQQHQQHEAAAVPATWSTENHEQEVFELPGSDEPPSIQRRNQTVHFPQVVDPDGARSWKRLIVEYN
ncbi:uncharacterized protein ACLA_022350 [Aspergillus clavatus NRRL 1]|uniref:Uncharacterized protein n=1 Tax=Aspergillus clavatus (strain ATCC 1007 / CBS 513.65 / DSM 816 / NCTC 3887 / NRRL 1 / QM 1276 / 107) TaxID=344612 RepID=A1CPF0_ASPCL|nr:uncharacterized protein ACLA_022350 [Aspergillus clavatus NRRL 1]EAW07521.1 conserved hypothetical protein [Aspergillus clavatus NRRL 1]